MKYVAMSVLLLAALAAGQYWEFEQVDSSALSGPTLAQMADGRLCVCYIRSDSNVRVAVRDSAWSYEAVGAAIFGRPVIAAGPHGTVGVVYDSNGTFYAERSDTGWASTRVPIQGIAMGLAYDSAGVPLVASVDAGSNVYVHAYTRPETTWLGVTLYTSGPGYLDARGSTVRPRFDHAGHAYVFAAYYWVFNINLWGAGLLLFQWNGSEWDTLFDTSMSNYYEAAALALDSAEQPAWCYHYYDGHLFLTGQPVDSGVGDAAMQFDALGRPQIAYVRNDSLMLRYRDHGGWHVIGVGVTGVTGVDLLLSSDMQPIIAYTTSEGVFLACGVDVVGVEDNHKPQAPSRKLAATVVRNLPAGAVAFDATGRRVLNPKSGVYFVQERSAAGGKPSAVCVRKVVIQR